MTKPMMILVIAMAATAAMACGNAPNTSADSGSGMDVVVQPDMIMIPPTDTIGADAMTNPEATPPADAPRADTATTDTPMMGIICHPSAADPMCTAPGMDACMCNGQRPEDRDLCEGSPQYCSAPTYNTCEIGRNLCGMDLPPGVTYNGTADFPDILRENVRNDYWTSSRSSGRIGSSLQMDVNGQLIVSFGVGTCSYWTWNAGKFWCRWLNMNSTERDLRGRPVGYHCWLEFFHGGPVGAEYRTYRSQCFAPGNDPRANSSIMPIEESEGSWAGNGPGG